MTSKDGWGPAVLVLSLFGATTSLEGAVVSIDGGPGEDHVMASAICGDGNLDPGETCDPPGPATCDCCQVQETAGCNDPACETALCAVDPFCCIGSWDSVCVAGALSLAACVNCCVDCRTDCKYCGDGVIDVPPEQCDVLVVPPGCDCCGTPEGPGCDDPACAAQVCGVDPFCCETAWDALCATHALEFLECLSCCPRIQCTDDCQLDQDGDGLADDADPCLLAPNPGGGPAVFGQPVFAADTGQAFVWPYALGFGVVRGDFASSFDVGGYVSEPVTWGAGTEHHDAYVPQPGTGAWYLWRPDCDDSSWVSGGESEVVCVSSSDCCVANGTPGCTDPVCRSWVCLTSPECCSQGWTGSCASLANALPACVLGCDGTRCRDAMLP